MNFRLWDDCDMISFMKNLLLWNLTAAVSILSALPSGAQPTYRLGTCDWSILSPLTVDSFLFAQENQLEGIQYTFGTAGDGLDLRERKHRDTIRQTVADSGVGIASMGLTVLNKIPLSSSDQAEQLVIECIETMATLKAEADTLADRDLAAKVAPSVLLLPFFAKGDINGQPELIEATIVRLKRLAPLAEQHGITLALESLLDEVAHRHIIDSVGSPAVTVYYDTANSARMGYDIYAEIKSLGTDYISEIHLKVNGALLDQGDIDFLRIRSILDKIGYTGWLILEGACPKGMDRQTATAHNAIAARRIFAPTMPTALLGDWSLDLENDEPAWLSLSTDEVRMRPYIGRDGPWPWTQLNDDSIRFTLRPLRKEKGSKIFYQQEAVVARHSDGQLVGTLTRTANDGSETVEIPFTGQAIPPMPEQAPDLSKVRYGERISLFNGQDLTGWRPHESDKINGWSVQDGLLINTTPKTDFSATGAHANLRTEEVYDDFRLQIDFLIGKDRNSGIYLRGMYEAQVVDRDSRMQGLQGVGAIFSRIAPSENAGKVGGEWQSYDITLVDRHITVILNGTKVIDNQPVIGPTGGAIHTDPMAPGPIYLQGDHTSVKYRNIYLHPIISTEHISH